MKKKKICIVLSSIVIVIICISVLHKQYNYVIKTDKQIVIGIIDGTISCNYDNVIVNSYIQSKVLTHGDKMIQFANACNSKNKIYYYDASDNGKISTDNIINALEWMVNNSVTKVNISLSCKSYNEKLDTWIDRNKNIIEVYASYNNNLNSYDYPAMYSNVIASGKKTSIKFKKNDYFYKSNKIITINNTKVKFYRGNSYLSLLTMIRTSI